MFKIGIIGAGEIAQNHESEIAKLDDCKITAVCDIREDAAKAIAEKHGARVFTDYRDLLKTDVDIVYILTPPFLHKEMTIAAAEAGKHIFVEKPLALSYEDCVEIKAAVDKAGVKCQVGYIVGYNPAGDTARRLFKENKIGDLVVIWDKRMHSANILNSSLGTHKDWLTDKNKSGGHLLECMTHEVQWMLSIGGEVESVYANIQSANPNPNITADDNCWAILKFKNGGIGVLGTSWSCPINSMEKGILGTAGVIEISGRKVKMAKNDDEVQEVETVADTNMSKQAHFNKCIRENLKPFNSINEAVYNIKVIIAMHKSSLNNEVVKL